MKDAIVIVDDEPIIIFAVKNELRNHYKDRFKYSSSTSADDALQEIEDLINEGSKVILIISDWLMPKTTGSELIKIVKSRHPEINCILLTGYFNKDEVLSLEEEGCIDTIVHKPWTSDTLLSAVQHALIKSDISYCSE